MQYQPNTLRRSSQRTFITLEYQNYGKLCVTWFVRVFGFLQQVGLTFVPWHRGSFFVGKIFINARILQDPFLVGIPSIRVIRGAQDVSLYIHAWRPSKAMSDSSKVYFSPSASFCQLLILYASWSSYSSVVPVNLIVLSWNRRLYGVVVYKGTSKVVGFVRTVSFTSCE